MKHVVINTALKSNMYVTRVHLLKYNFRYLYLKHKHIYFQKITFGTHLYLILDTFKTFTK